MILDLEATAGISTADVPQEAAPTELDGGSGSHLELERLTADLAALVEHSEDAIVSSNLDGTILTWNRGAVNVYGYRAEEVVGKSVAMLYPPDRLTEFEKLLAEVQQGRSIAQSNTERVRKD